MDVKPNRWPSLLALAVFAGTFAAPSPAFANEGDAVIGFVLFVMPAWAIAIAGIGLIAWLAKVREVGVFTKIVFGVLFWPCVLLGVASLPVMLRHGGLLAIPYVLELIAFCVVAWIAHSRLPTLVDLRTRRMLRGRDQGATE